MTLGVRLEEKHEERQKKREGLTAGFYPSRVPQRREPCRKVQGNTVTVAKSSGSQNFPILITKTSVPEEASTM
ncbi:hypothetical protein NPIL_653231 [Nephila pilipes]|uniref:Uncharacterized protein n=1 Tax=Nephila pilipes TaxID=299642 RepID=A0A8X6UDK5_NEPPI|nr:hypothetical protein NPIL_653231 [Nephila pilipes]